jgi:hypothetical protein
MFPRSIILVLAPGLLGLACLKPNPLVEQLAEGGDTGTETDAETDATDDSESDDSGSSSGDLPGTCTQPAELTLACGTCLAEHCCDALEQCSATCTCVLACILAGDPELKCKTECGATPNAVPELDPLLECMDVGCSEAC